MIVLLKNGPNGAMKTGMVSLRILSFLTQQTGQYLCTPCENFCELLTGMHITKAIENVAPGFYAVLPGTSSVFAYTGTSSTSTWGR